MPVDLSRIMVTDSMLQLLLVRYACIWQTNWGIERASGGESWQLSCGHSGYVEERLTSDSVKSGSRPRKMTCGLGSLGTSRFLLCMPPPPPFCDRSSCCP